MEECREATLAKAADPDRGQAPAWLPFSPATATARAPGTDRLGAWIGIRLDMSRFAAHPGGNPKTSTCRPDFQSGIS
jgi:hypothetical protein